MLKSGLACAALATALFAAALSSPARAQLAVGITAEVPTICRVDLEAGAAGAPARLNEFCNSPGGYDVVVDHDPALAGRVLVDGQVVPLSPTGSTVLSTSPGPEARVRRLVLLVDETGGPLTVRIVPRS